MKDKRKELDERAASAKDWVEKKIAEDSTPQSEIDEKWKRYDATMTSIKDGIRKLVLPDSKGMSDLEKYEHIVVAVAAQLSAVASTIALFAKINVMSKEHAIDAMQSADDLDREIAVALVTHAQFEHSSVGVTAEALAAFDESIATKQ